MCRGAEVGGRGHRRDRAIHFTIDAMFTAQRQLCSVSTTGASVVLRSVIGRSRQRILVSADVTAQCETMLDNVETLLGEVGLELKHLVRTVLYLTDDADVVR